MFGIDSTLARLRYHARQLVEESQVTCIDLAQWVEQCYVFSYHENQFTRANLKLIGLLARPKES